MRRDADCAAMTAIWGQVAAAVLPKLVGGIFGKKDAKKQNAANTRAMYEQRAYDRSLYEDQKVFGLLNKRDDRAYSERMTADDRAYAARLTADDRNYIRVENDRGQALQDRYAREDVASRGFDWQKMRDAAVSAGFNPLTALASGALGGYSTDVNRTVYNGAGAGGGMNAAAQRAPVASFSGGGFATSGAGYQREFNPALSSGGFIAEALDRGLDTYFNSPQQADPLADALRNAIGQDAYRSAAASVNPYQNFGYDLTKTKSFEPRVAGGRPPLKKPNVKQVLGFNLEVPPGLQSADDSEEWFGEAGGFLQGVGNLSRAAGYTIGKATGLNQTMPVIKKRGSAWGRVFKRADEGFRELNKRKVRLPW